MSNAGQAVLTVVGTVVGTYFGNPALGYTLGNLAGQALFPTDLGTVTGPRLNDLSVQTSTIGAPVPIVYGTFALAGNVIWSSGIIETVKKKRQGGKGGPTQTVKTYSYKVHCAVGICEGEIAGIKRIWADAVLIYDERPLQDGETIDAYTARIEANAALLANTEFYYGTEDQLADPTLESYEGTGNVSGYRGLAYVVFSEFQLENYGNRVPSFRFEVTSTREPQPPIVLPTYLADSELSYTNGVEEVAPCFEAQQYAIYGTQSGSPQSDIRIGIFSIPSNVQIKEFKFSTATGYDIHSILYAFSMGLDGHIYACDFITLNDWVIWKIDPDSVSTVWMTAASSSSAFFPEQSLEIGIVGASATEAGNRFLVTAPFYEGLFMILDGADGTLIGAVQSHYPGSGANGMCRVARGYSDATRCEAWLFDAPLTPWNTDADFGEPLYIHRVRLMQGATTFVNLYASPVTSPYSSADDAELLTFEFLATALQPYVSAASPANIIASVVEAGPFVWDGHDGDGVNSGPLFFCRVCDADGIWGWDQWFLVKLSGADGSVLWATEVLGAPSGWNDATGTARLRDRYFYFTYGVSTVYQVDLTDGTIVSTNWLDTFNDYSVTSMGAVALYDSVLNAVVCGGVSTAEPYLLMFDDYAAGDGITLGEIVRDQCERAGLAAVQVDVTDLTETVDGYCVTRVMSTRDAIEPLRSYGYFDCVESDGVLKWPTRGKASVATIAADDLAAHPSGDTRPAAVRISRTQEVELPRRLRVHYAQTLMNYEPGEQGASRLAAGSLETVDAEVAVAMSASKAAQIAETLLWEAWVGRNAYTFALDHSYAYLEPADVVTLPVEGRAERVRLLNVEYALPGLLQMEAVRDDASVYESEALGSVAGSASDTGGGSSVSTPGTAQLVLLDLPMLADEHDEAGYYAAIYAAGGTSFNGAALYRSVDGGATYDEVAATLLPAAVGALTAALPAGPTTIIDEGNVLRIALSTTDELESVTETGMLAGLNAAAIGAAGRWEVVQFRDVTALGAGWYELRGLLRGRAGTEWAVGSSQSGDSFVLLDSAVIRVMQNVSALGQERYHKAVLTGATLASGTPQAFAGNGVALKPYSVTDIRGTRSGGDLVLTWIRRSRLGQELPSGTDIPLGEASERYEVDIMSAGSPASVLRTLSATSATVTYTAAQAAADFGSMPGAVTVRVYQLSATVGRGYVSEDTV